MCYYNHGVKKMEKKDMLKEIIDNNNGIVSTSMLNRIGFDNSEITRYFKSGRLKRLQQGLYTTGDWSEIADEAIIKTILPDAVICMESALFLYGYSNWTPREWTLAVPRTISRSRLSTDIVTLKPYYVQPGNFELGISSMDINGVKMAVYDRERTICDCFKYRNKMDRELFNECIHAYSRDPNRNIGRLYRYASEMKILDKVNSVMEVILDE